MLGEVGNGWHQVTAELGFERSGPERILSTATLVFAAVRALAEQDIDDRTAAEVGDLMARMISLRQLSVSVARTLSDGQDAASRAALVKDLGTRFEQDSVELVADLIDGRRSALTALRAAARPAGHRPAALALVHAARRHERGAARSGRQGHGGAVNELTQLVDDIGRRSFDARLGHRGAPDEFDAALWRHLEETGLSRLTSSQEAGPAEAAIVLSGLARHAGAVPIAETDLLAAWLAGEAAVDVPDSGPLTVAITDAETVGRQDRRRGDRGAVAALGPGATGRAHRRSAPRRCRRRPPSDRRAQPRR